MASEMMEPQWEVERDIRIAIWNAAIKGGMGDDAAIRFIQRAIAEPTMVRALATLSASKDLDR